jgi:hypothetical protein
MRRASIREGRRRRGDRLGLALLVLSCAAVASLVAYRWFGLPTAPGADNCPSPAPLGLQAVLIDSTDTLTEPQRIDVRNRLVAARQALPVGWAVQVWRVAPLAEQVPIPLAETICKPDPEPNPLTANTAEGRRRSSQFDQTLQRLFDEALQAKEEPQSPILETIQAIGLRFFRNPSYSSVGERRLLIASDLIQNTNAITQTSDVADFDKFRSTEPYSRLRIDLDSVRVTVLYLSRPGARDRAGHIEWWQRLFADYRALLERVERITG